ncbi:beta-Ala-His dipeptidase [Nakamurella leprariae]|uniref:Beta-Ala-His dipeptidase n=1 Tax=Nakamurella leprariae TaxID=2803911 RepID=A0A938YAB3_9ACTN|nr:beta-Ala-His dipeptidase [Nakamurella leprariae]MBM9465958.1 beta-Ala-His dipeptidase [Nakamurella leprariae]
MPVLEKLEPQEVLRFFEILSDIPRGSENEQQVADWVVAFARERGLTAFQDAAHCVVVRKPGQGGLEDAPTLILHGHLDMVCAKDEGVEIDFLTEPIRLVVDGDFIRADGTSLGADNGIGVSYILALLDTTDLPHPPLEAVLTAMEEKGKVGAGQFDTSVLTGTRMIDFNWITDTEILAGCSGDVTFLVDIPGEFQAVPSELSATRSVQVRGLLGGHCEFDIHLERANAIQLVARVLNTVLARYPARISGLVGGTQNSAIPADAEVVLSLRPQDVTGVETLITDLADVLHAEYERAGDAIRIEVAETGAPAKAFGAAATARFARLTALIPNGVLSWSLLTPGVVESSNNLGTLRPTEDGVRLASTITAQVTSRKHEILQRAEVLAALAGGGVTVQQFGLDAPEFPYQRDSGLLRTAAEAYRDVIGSEPDIHVSQCSLELGMFSRKIPGLEIISIGTELHALHSPLEKVNHTSVARVWPLVREVVGRLR